MRVAIVGTRWPDVELERDILGVDDADITRDPGVTMQGILDAASDAEVILAGPRPRFDAVTIEGLNGRGIVRYGAGYENIDVAAARRRGMEVAYVPDYGTEAVAMHAVALALTLLRRIKQADRLVQDGAWELAQLRPLHLPSELTVGIVGFGRIGRRTAHLFAGLGFGRILGYDEHVEVAAPGVSAAPLESLLSESDVVSMHASAAGDGAPVIGSREIGLFKEGSILVNTARGSLIDPDALASGLRANRPALAGLDVFEPEPPDLDRLSDVAERIVMTPHMAWYTEETELDLRKRTAQEARRILDGEPVRYPVEVLGEPA